jgi:hypothetical protein
MVGTMEGRFLPYVNIHHEGKRSHISGDRIYDINRCVYIKPALIFLALTDDLAVLTQYRLTLTTHFLFTFERPQSR